MYNYIWADPFRELPANEYSFYATPGASGTGTNTEHPAQSTLSLASEGLTAPTLMDESPARTDGSQNLMIHTRDCTVQNHNICTTPDAAGIAMDKESRVQNTLSLANEGVTAPDHINESSTESDNPQTLAVSSSAFRRRWYLRRNQDGFLVEPVLKDYRQTSEDTKEAANVVALLNEPVNDTWNNLPIADDGESVIKHQHLFSTNGTLSCDHKTHERAMTDCGYTTRDNSEAYVTDELYNVPLLPLSEASPHPASLAEVLNESQRQVSSAISELALERSDKDFDNLSSIDVSEMAVGGNEDSGATLMEYKSQVFHENCQFQFLLSEATERSTEQGRNRSEASDVTNIPHPLTPPASPEPYHTQQVQDSKVALAVGQYERGAGILWECARQLLERDRLYPADLTESEFVELVCCEKSETYEWLEKNILRIINRSVVKFMNSRQRLMDAGIDSPSRDDAFVYAFEYMSDEEQETTLFLYQKFQLQEIARMKNIHLTQDDETAFMSLPVIARTSLVRKYLNMDEEGDFVVDPSIWTQPDKGKPPQDPEEKSEMESTLSELVHDDESRVNESLENSAGVEAPPLPPRLFVSDPRITFEHVEYVQETAPRSTTINAREIGSTSSAETELVPENVQAPRDCNLRRSPAQKNPVRLAHEFRALEFRPKSPSKVQVHDTPPNRPGRKRDATNTPGILASIESDAATDLEPDHFTVTPLISASQKLITGNTQRASSQKSQKSLNNVSFDVPTSIKALPTPRKASEFPRPLTPIPDTSPYQRRSVHFKSSSASTASIDTVMLGISSPLQRVSRVEPSPPYYSMNRAIDSLESLYSLFDAKFDAYADDDETDFADDATVVDSRRSSHATSTSSRRQRLKLKLRKVFSAATIRSKTVAVEDKEIQVEDERIKELFKTESSLKKRVSTVWGSMSLRSGSKRSAI